MIQLIHHHNQKITEIRRITVQTSLSGQEVILSFCCSGSVTFFLVSSYYYIVAKMKKYQLGGFEEVVLLAVGILHKNAYTVTLKDEIEHRLSRDVSIGSLQVTLRRLEAKGFLKSKHEQPGEAESDNRRGRPRLFFELTAYGKKAIVQTRESREDFWKALKLSEL
jgi:PadR family transcriptional regulator PadR